jgi:hypothetical protein
MIKTINYEETLIKGLHYDFTAEVYFERKIENEGVYSPSQSDLEIWHIEITDAHLCDHDVPDNFDWTMKEIIEDMKEHVRQNPKL